MPAALTHFIGRQVDLERLIDLLEDPSIRLVSILGVGGMGKTRLALELAQQLEREFEHGVVFVPLVQLNSIDELLPALASSLGVSLPPGGDLQQVVLDHLTDRQMLLVLDNFEHLVEEALLVQEILVAAPRVKLLVTSREKLRLEAETLYHLSGLELLPEDMELGVEQSDAVRLFMQKARQTRPGFSLNEVDTPAVARICRLVDGSPLGILLAAAWIEFFSPTEIASQITTSLDFLSQQLRGGEVRHASMRAVIQASFERLNEHQQAVFLRLATFRGGFDLAAAQAVAGADLRTLVALADKSMLARDPSTGRFDLHELLRQFASEQLSVRGELESALAAHAGYFLKFIQEREHRMVGPGQTATLDSIQRDFDNIRQAWSFAVDHRDFAGVRGAVVGLYQFCDIRSRTIEREALFRHSVDGLAPLTGEPADPSWALVLLSWYDMHIYIERFEVFDKITAQTQACLEAARAAKDIKAEAASLILLGTITEDQGDYKSAIPYFEQAMNLYPQLDIAYWVIIRIGLCQMELKQYAEAIDTFKASLRRGKENGEQVKIGWSLFNIGESLIAMSRPADARSYLQQAGGYFQEVGSSDGIIWTNFSLGKAALDLNDRAVARRHAEIANQVARETHYAKLVKMTEELLARIDPQTPKPPSKKIDEVESLSQRELEVLRLLKTELSGPEIARELVVSLNTVRFHTKNIYQKLGVNTRLEAIQRAKELGL